MSRLELQQLRVLPQPGVPSPLRLITLFCFSIRERREALYYTKPQIQRHYANVERDHLVKIYD